MKLFLVFIAMCFAGCSTLEPTTKVKSISRSANTVRTCFEDDDCVIERMKERN